MSKFECLACDHCGDAIKQFDIAYRLTRGIEGNERFIGDYCNERCLKAMMANKPRSYPHLAPGVMHE